jgi:hypothetical protein
MSVCPAIRQILHFQAGSGRVQFQQHVKKTDAGNYFTNRFRGPFCRNVCSVEAVSLGSGERV